MMSQTAFPIAMRSEGKEEEEEEEKEISVRKVCFLKFLKKKIRTINCDVAEATTVTRCHEFEGGDFFNFRHGENDEESKNKNTTHRSIFLFFSFQRGHQPIDHGKKTDQMSMGTPTKKTVAEKIVTNPDQF